MESESFAMDETVNHKHNQVLSAGIYQLLLQRRMLDVTITCGGEAIMAHKAVLVAYSKFLDTVFAGQGDDCDVLNMDNLGLEFEAIRAVIFFMYKGAIDVERCGEAAFHNAAKILAVDTSTQITKCETSVDSSLVSLENNSVTSVAVQPKEQPEPKQKCQNKDQMTMTDAPRLLKLTRFSQTESLITGLPIEKENNDQTKKKLVARYNKETQAGTIGNMIQKSVECQTAPQLLVNLGLEENKSNLRILKCSSENDSSSVKTHPTKQTPKKVIEVDCPELSEREDDDDVDNKTEDLPKPASRRSSARISLRQDSRQNDVSKRKSVGKSESVKVETPQTVKRGRGRPRKNPESIVTSSPMPKIPKEPVIKQEPHDIDDIKPKKEIPKRKSGRPRKIKLTSTDDAFDWMGTPKPRRTKVPVAEKMLSPRGSSELYSPEKKNLWRKDDTGNFHCLVCDWSRPTSKSLVVHLRMHLDERPFICETCGKAFRTSDKLKDHNRVHSGERPFPCDTCRATFKTNKALLRHHLIHTQDKYHKCEKCDKAFYTREHLTAHVNHVHENIKRYGCTAAGCIFRASEKKTVLYHEAEKHGKPLPAHLVTMCDICGVSVRNSSLRMHKLIHTAKNLKCSHCNFTTQYKNTLNGHMQRRHGVNINGTEAIKPHKCATCEESFFSRQQLKFHDLRHKGYKPHKCPICDFSTVDKGSMNMHIRTHTGATPYACKYCHKSFKQSSALCWHVKTVHEGLRRFNCHECNKSYVNKKDLRAHRYSVHLKIKPFSCSHCNYCCTKKEYLAQHMERSHAHLGSKNLAIRKMSKKYRTESPYNSDTQNTYDSGNKTNPSSIEENYQIVDSVLAQEASVEQGEQSHAVVIVPQQTMQDIQTFEIEEGTQETVIQVINEVEMPQIKYEVEMEEAQGKSVLEIEEAQGKSEVEIEEPQCKSEVEMEELQTDHEAQVDPENINTENQ